MKALKRDFTPRERMLLILLSLIILALIYYLTVQQPVSSGMAETKSEKAALQVQIDAINRQLASIDAWKREKVLLAKYNRDDMYMPSYNASNDELDFLNETLGGTLDYYIGFNEVTREGDQIRRAFSLSYSATGYQAAVDVLAKLERSNIRCLIGDFSVSPYGESTTLVGGPVTVNATATFFETMYGGKPDKELPEDTAPQLTEEPEWTE